MDGVQIKFPQNSDIFNAQEKLRKAAKIEFSSVSPPTEDSVYSFGPTLDFLSDSSLRRTSSGWNKFFGFGT